METVSLEGDGYFLEVNQGVPLASSPLRTVLVKNDLAD